MAPPPSRPSLCRRSPPQPLPPLAAYPAPPLAGDTPARFPRRRLHRAPPPNPSGSPASSPSRTTHPRPRGGFSFLPRSTEDADPGTQGLEGAVACSPKRDQDASLGRPPDAGAVAPRHDQRRLGSVPSDVLASEGSRPLLLTDCCAAGRCPDVENKSIVC
jgi:hypothetical protein